jgi:hypothetical protein
MSTDHNLTNDFQEKSSIKTLGDRLAVAIETNLNNDQFGVDSLAHSVGMSRSSLHRKLPIYRLSADSDVDERCFCPNGRRFGKHEQILGRVA